MAMACVLGLSTATRFMGTISVARSSFHGTRLRSDSHIPRSFQLAHAGEFEKRIRVVGQRLQLTERKNPKETGGSILHRYSTAIFMECHSIGFHDVEAWLEEFLERRGRGVIVQRPWRLRAWISGIFSRANCRRSFCCSWDGWCCLELGRMCRCGDGPLTLPREHRHKQPCGHPGHIFRRQHWATGCGVIGHCTVH